jgi:hypothetical protein
VWCVRVGVLFGCGRDEDEERQAEKETTDEDNADKRVREREIDRLIGR